MLTMISRELRRSFALLVRTFRRRRSCLVSQAGADGALTSDAGCAPGGAALLAIVVSKGRALMAKAIDVCGPIAHLTTTTVPDVPPANVVTPDEDYDIGSVLRLQSQSPLAG
jgi:hypothetical protein